MTARSRTLILRAEAPGVPPDEARTTPTTERTPEATTMMEQPDRQQPRDHPSTGFRPSGRQIAAGVIAVLLVIFIASNTKQVEISFILTSVTLPLWLVLAVTTGLGVLIGMGLGTRRTKRKYMSPS